MNEVNNNRHYRRNHGYYANPETIDTKPAIFDSHFYFLTLPRRWECAFSCHPLNQRVSDVVVVKRSGQSLSGQVI